MNSSTVGSVTIVVPGVERVVVVCNPRQVEQCCGYGWGCARRRVLYCAGVATTANMAKHITIEKVGGNHGWGGLRLCHDRFCERVDHQ
jgi:hypothetical protein